jgi:ATP-dependent Zn protease
VILKEHGKELDETVQLLLKRETLNAEDLPAIGPDGAKAAE